jgi:hypothetical protein
MAKKKGGKVKAPTLFFYWYHAKKKKKVYFNFITSYRSLLITVPSASPIEASVVSQRYFSYQQKGTGRKFLYRF